jgi:beta-galactosidase/beta-glucuronidase
MNLVSVFVMKPARLYIALLLLSALVVPVGFADEWHLADGPLLTRWSKEVSPTNALPEYPRPQMVRKAWKNLNGLWEYAITGKDDAAPEKYDGKILVPYPIESTLSGVMKRVGEKQRLWYRRSFELGESFAGKRTLLHFGAVDWQTTVLVNGKHVGAHRGGYDPFTFDITDALKANGENQIEVSVWDPTNAGPQPRGKQVNKPGGIFYTPVTGIWQTVWLEPVPTAHIEAIKLTPDVDTGVIKVLVTGSGTRDDSRVSASVTLDGQRIGGEVVGKVGVEFEIPLKGAKLWTPETPTLYSLQLGLPDFDASPDPVTSYFAMRKISIGKDENGITRPMLNGKFVFQMGPLDQGFWPDGIYTAPTDAALKYDIEITKKLGFNMTRKHVKVEPDRWYYWCDKLGLLVWQDMPAGDKGVGPGKGEIEKDPAVAKEFENELKAMIDALRNHPCIVQWVVFNEGWGQYDTMRITEWTKQYDPSRLVDNASGWNDMKCGDVHDMHKYPAPGMPPVEDKRASVLGEYGGLGLPTDGHMWEKKNWGYAVMKGPDQLTRKYVSFARKLADLKQKGLSAAVYTQLTDVETEANGLLTYDRQVIKPNLEKIAAANRFDFAGMEDDAEIEIVPTARTAPQPWKFTVGKPADGWEKSDFKADDWKEGKSGFGTEGTPGSIIGTVWKTNDIWLRREVAINQAIKSPQLVVHHDDDVEVYLNGVLAYKSGGYVAEI